MIPATRILPPVRSPLPRSRAPLLPIPLFLFLFLFLFLALGAPRLVLGAERWDAVAYQAANPILLEGSLVAHDDGAQLRVFSSTAQRFESLAPTGSPILGSGDHLLVTRFDGIYRAWSSRWNLGADLVQSLPLVHAAFGDDVAVLVFQPVGGGTTTAAYSAVTNQWKQLSAPIPAPIATNVAVSRFVAAARTSQGIFGFSSRKGEWVPLPNSTGAAPPQADGNVAVTTGTLSPFGNFSAAAFSGVLGTWALSSPLVPGTSVQLDHNVAFCRARSGTGHWVAQGYSAYNGRFVTSTVQHALTLPQATYLSDNVVAITSAVDATPGVEAFGARPGLAFAFLPSNVGGLYVPIGEDYLISQPVSGVKEVHVFSGLCGGTFLPHAYANTFSGGFGGVHGFLAVDIGNALVGYSAAKHAFDTVPIPPVYDLEVEDAVAELRQYLASGARFHSFAARHGHFTTSPDQEPGASFATSTGGSFIARQQTNGQQAGQILIYDERCDLYPALHAPGGASQMTPGENVLLVALEAAPHSVQGYSVARGDWRPAPSAASGPPLVAPIAERDVGAYVDADGRLWAFGGDEDLHPFHAYPNESEFQTVGVSAGELVVPPSPHQLAFRGEPADLAYLLFALGVACPGVKIGGFQNLLCLDLATFHLIGPIGAIPASRVLVMQGGAISLPAPTCVQVWLQSLLTGGPSGNRVGEGCAGLWFF